MPEKLDHCDGDPQSRKYGLLLTQDSTPRWEDRKRLNLTSGFPPPFLQP